MTLPPPQEILNVSSFLLSVTDVGTNFTLPRPVIKLYINVKDRKFSYLLILSSLHTHTLIYIYNIKPLNAKMQVYHFVITNNGIAASCHSQLII